MPDALVAQIVADNTNIYTQKLRDVTPGWGTYLNEVLPRDQKKRLTAG
jgi:hypothetical protein